MSVHFWNLVLFSCKNIRYKTSFWQWILFWLWCPHWFSWKHAPEVICAGFHAYYHPFSLLPLSFISPSDSMHHFPSVPLLTWWRANKQPHVNPCTVYCMYRQPGTWASLFAKWVSHLFIFLLLLTPHFSTAGTETGERGIKKRGGGGTVIRTSPSLKD